MTEKRSGKSELNACDLWWISRLPKFPLLTATAHNETVTVPFGFSKEPTLMERRLEALGRLIILDEWHYVPDGWWKDFITPL